ncbi:hypothetical protein MTBUT4_110118 [Magnetospirillum sp. UT-4]|nr:hypothetical protein MTBUT4_110118 [Magnetospirillum sp. UT-4]
MKTFAPVTELSQESIAFAPALGLCAAQPKLSGPFPL